MIKKEDVEALREQIQPGDMVEVEFLTINSKMVLVSKKKLCRVRRKYRHLAELEGPGHQTISYIDIMLNRIKKMEAQNV